MDYPTRTLNQLDGFTDISTVIFDELALAPANVLETVSFCMRGKNIHPHIYAMTTPRMFSWLNRYIEENSSNIDIIRATTLDNVFISQEQIELMKSTCANDKMLRQELYGEIVEDSDAGTIFSFDILNRTNTLKTDLPFNIGIDCSGLGTDFNVVVARNDTGILKIKRYQTIEPQHLATEVLNVIHELGRDRLSQIFIDEAYRTRLSIQATRFRICTYTHSVWWQASQFSLHEQTSRNLFQSQEAARDSDCMA